MKPLPHPYRPIPGKGEYCQKSGHTGHYRRAAHKEWPAGHYVGPTRTETMRSEDDKRRDRHSTEMAQSRGVAMGLQQRQGAAHDARRDMIRNNAPCREAG